MYCKKCGYELLPGGNVCPNCGTNQDLLDNVQVKKDVTIFVVFGFIFAAISLFFFPPIFGALGIVFSTKVKKQKSSLGIFMLSLSIIFMIVGMVYGAIANLQRLGYM